MKDSKELRTLVNTKLAFEITHWIDEMQSFDEAYKSALRHSNDEIDMILDLSRKYEDSEARQSRLDQKDDIRNKVIMLSKNYKFNSLLELLEKI